MAPARWGNPVLAPEERFWRPFPVLIDQTKINSSVTWTNNCCFILFPRLLINIIFFALTKNGRQSWVTSMGGCQKSWFSGCTRNVGGWRGRHIKIKNEPKHQFCSILFNKHVNYQSADLFYSWVETAETNMDSWIVKTNRQMIIYKRWKFSTKIINNDDNKGRHTLKKNASLVVGPLRGGGTPWTTKKIKTFFSMI